VIDNDGERDERWMGIGIYIAETEGGNYHSPHGLDSSVHALQALDCGDRHLGRSGYGKESRGVGS